MTRIISPTPSAYNPPMLIKSILKNSLAYESDKEILYRDQVRMNYDDLHRRVAQLANALVAMGVKQGDVIGVIEFDSHRYLELYFAVPMIGAVLHTINFRLSPDQIVYTMNHAEDKVVFCHQAFLPILSAIHPKLDTVGNYVLLKEKDDTLAEVNFPIEGEYEALLSKQPGDYDFPDFDENSMATLFYTTGTTGLPKGVCFSHRQLVLHTLAVATSAGGIDSPVAISAKDNYMPMTPMFHVHAWGIPYVATMLGMKQIYPGAYEPQMLAKLILTENVTFSHCVPAILSLLINHPKAHEFDLTRMKVIIGGSALPKGLARGALKHGINVLAGYGMSETCPILTLPYVPVLKASGRTEDEEINERIKTGRPVLFVELKLMDDDGNFLPFDGKTIGEIVVRAPWLTQRYYKEEERSEELWKYGYMHTGDMAYVEPNGTVVIADRKKDVIKSGGEWISTLELESLISAHEAVKEVAVIGIPDEKWDERPLALVVLNEGKDIDKSDLVKHLQQFVKTGHISKWSIPEQYRFVNEIPKTSVGKIDKKLIRSKIAEGSI